MAHIQLPEGLPGIVGPMMQYPKTERPLNALAEALLRGPSPLTPAERELIATYVSSLNACSFCMNVHAAATRHLLGAEGNLVAETLQDPHNAPLSEKMRALLAIARKVQQGGRNVTPEEVARAKDAGADDETIHDTVLIAAAFCMFNRYVDGLATLIPEDDSRYDPAGERLAREGYLNSIPR
jgi:uncharacterized peroxidase-related enzyme